MSGKLIIDLGAHKGEDSDFYLRKGFRVIAVDASAKLCEEIGEKFKHHPNGENFQIFNYAITETDDEQIEFFENTGNSVWGTIFESWDNRNKKFGTSSLKRTVQTKRLDTLLLQEMKEDEEIEYVKIDIEGADMMALQSISKLAKKPNFVSWESEKLSWEKLVEEFRIAKALGYNFFKVIDQTKVSAQKCPNPPKEGNFVDFAFQPGSSGLFGRELPGPWLSETEALKIYKKIFWRYKYFGDYGVFNNKLVMKNRVLRKLMRIAGLKFPHVGWYDTHAALTAVD